MSTGCVSSSAGTRGDNGNSHAQRRSVRDDERVDEKDRGYPLCAGLLHGTSSVPRDRERLPGGHFKRNQRAADGERRKLPDAVLACVGGGSNAIGAFYHFINDKSVRLIGCEAAGRGVNTAETAATIATGSRESSMA